MSYFADAGRLLISFFFGAALALFVLRILAEACRADFHNPVSQMLYRYTNPVLAPIRRLVPNWRRINLAALLLAWGIEVVKLLLLFALSGMMPGVAGLFLLGFAQLLDFVILVYLIVIFAWALMSMLGGDPMHPVTRIMDSIVAPVMRPLRRRMPSLGGLDFSPTVAMVVLLLLRILAIQPLVDLGTRLALSGI